MLKKFRKELKISNKEIENTVGLKNKSSIYYLEGTFMKNKMIKYLLLLRKRGVNINSYFDDIIKDNKL